MDEIFIVINAKTKKIVTAGQVSGQDYRLAFVDNKFTEDEKLIFESDNILTEASIQTIKNSFLGKCDIELEQYSEKEVKIQEKPKSIPAPALPSLKEELKAKLKTTPKPKNQNELIEMIEDIRTYLVG